MNQWSNAKLCDVANLILGAILLTSPWVFAFASGPQTQNSVGSGAIIVILSIAALAAFAFWEEWLNLIVGLWVLASPWVLGFQASTETTVHVTIGILVAVLAAVEIRMMHQNQPTRSAI
jgi:heme/copper-type cytochrome/quinol oxidase subunit 3